jgi:redox-sensitive bicupin YhaK (pirin superfamily)
MRNDMETQVKTAELIERNVRLYGLDAPALTPPRQRSIRFVTAGQSHGPITRLASPSDVGELIKPFVFLDLADVAPRSEPLFGFHPHSGIATLTTVLRGGMVYEDTTGKSGTVLEGGLEWMRAGNGVWHDGGPAPGQSIRAFQLWVALPPWQENGDADSQYIEPQAVESEGPARVILGNYGRAKSAIRHAPVDINYLHVTLKDGERWTYTPPKGHDVAWLAVDAGTLDAAKTIHAGELAVFEDSEQAIELVARGFTSFVLGSAVKHPHPLVLGRHSVHTTHAALAQGQMEINRIGRRLRAEGRI